MPPCPEPPHPSLPPSAGDDEAPARAARPGVGGAPDDVRVSLHGPLVPARFVERPNRFLVVATLDDGREVEAHLPDPGRLVELLLPERRLWLRPADAPSRRTRWTAVLVEGPDGCGRVSLDTTLPNRLALRALEAGALDELEGWRLVRAEWPHQGSRLDFLLEGAGGARLALEVKSVTLVKGRVALFPDAVTARGTRHVRALAALAGRDGWAAAVIFLVQRSDCDRVAAAHAIDPAFAQALAEARAAGVRVLARRCHVAEDHVRLGGPLPTS